MCTCMNQLRVMFSSGGRKADVVVNRMTFSTEATAASCAASVALVSSRSAAGAGSAPAAAAAAVPSVASPGSRRAAEPLLLDRTSNRKAQIRRAELGMTAAFSLPVGTRASPGGPDQRQRYTSRDMRATFAFHSLAPLATIRFPTKRYGCNELRSRIERGTVGARVGLSTIFVKSPPPLQNGTTTWLIP